MLKWGEHSNDVQFILQWSPLDSSAKGQASKNVPSDSSPIDHSNSSHSSSSKSNNSHSNSPRGLIKTPNILHSSLSRSFASGKANSTLQQDLSGLQSGIDGQKNDSQRSSSVSQRLVSPDSGNAPDVSTSTLDILSCSSGVKMQSSSTGSNVSKESASWNGKLKGINSPPPYRDPPNPVKYSSGSGQSPTSMSSGQSSHAPVAKELPPYREPPPPISSSIQQQQRVARFSPNYSPNGSQNYSHSPKASLTSSSNHSATNNQHGYSPSGMAGNTSNSSVTYNTECNSKRSSESSNDPYLSFNNSSDNPDVWKKVKRLYYF